MLAHQDLSAPPSAMAELWESLKPDTKLEVIKAASRALGIPAANVRVSQSRGTVHQHSWLTSPLEKLALRCNHIQRENKIEREPNI